MNKKIKPIRDAYIWEHCYCSSCRWHVVVCNCNGLMSQREWGGWDWWIYCPNKGCKNHGGEGLFQDTPDWVIDTNYEE